MVRHLVATLINDLMGTVANVLSSLTQKSIFVFGLSDGDMISFAV